MIDHLGTIILLVVWIGQMGSVASIAGAEGNGVGPAPSKTEECTAWMQVKDWRVRVADEVKRLALGQRCGGRRGKRPVCRQAGRYIRRIRRRRRQVIVVWRRLKPVSEELVEEEIVRETSELEETKAQGTCSKSSGGIQTFKV